MNNSLNNKLLTDYLNSILPHNRICTKITGVYEHLNGYRVRFEYETEYGDSNNQEYVSILDLLSFIYNQPQIQKEEERMMDIYNS
jgi:hypothetical protein